MTVEPTRGQLLVATPLLGDPNFARTVVLLLEANEKGAVGVVLNRPSDTVLLDALPAWAGRAADPPVVFVGGPVEQTAAIGLARGDQAAEVVDGVGLLDLDQEPDAAPAIDAVRIFAGYAGWGPGQLEGEIEEGAWFVVDADPADALSPEPDALWRSVLRRQRGDVALYAAFPDDPALN